MNELFDSIFDRSVEDNSRNLRGFDFRGNRNWSLVHFMEQKTSVSKNGYS